MASCIPSNLDQICAICHNQYHVPRLLNCLHSFCHQCLEKKLSGRKHKGNQAIICPICQTETPIGGEVSDLTKNKALETYLDRQQSLVLWRQGDTNTSHCQSCFKEGEIVARCLHDLCKHFLCADCLKAHKEMIIFSDHNVISLTDMKKSAVRIPLRKCSEHPEYWLAFYCMPCLQISCEQCVKSNHFQSDHEVKELSKLSNKYRDSLKTRIPKLEQVTTQFQKRIHEVDTLQEKLVRYKEDASQKANRAHIAKSMSHILLESDDADFMQLYPEVHAAVEEINETYPEEIPCVHNNNNGHNDQYYADQDDSLNDMGNNVHMDEESDGEPSLLLANGENESSFNSTPVYPINGYANGSNYASVGEQDIYVLDEHDQNTYPSTIMTMGEEDQDTPPFNNKVEYDDSDSDSSSEPPGPQPRQPKGKNARRLSYDDHGDQEQDEHAWFRVGKFGKMGNRNGEFNFARGVAISPANNDIAVADHTNNRVDLFTTDGEFKITLKSWRYKSKGKCHFSSAEDLAFNSTGHLFVVDKSKFVQKFSIEGHFMTKFSVLPNGSKARVCSSCIAVGSDSRIYVGDCLRASVTICKENGKIVQTVKIPLSPSGGKVLPMFLAISKKRHLLIAANGRPDVYHMDLSHSKYQTMDTFEIKQDVKKVSTVTGIVWDDITNGFFVATQQKKRGYGKVHYYNRHGEYVKTVVGKKLNNPLGLAFSTNSMLVVADMLSVKLFHSQEPSQSSQSQNY